MQSTSPNTFHIAKDPVPELEVPFNFGKPFRPFPLPYASYDFSPVKWYWLPGFQMDLRFFISVSAFLCFILAAVLGFAVGGTGGTASSLAFLALVALLGALRGNMAINQMFRTALCHSYFKSEEAKQLWNPQTMHEKLLAKDVFHTEKNFTGDILVLRDGTIELRSARDYSAQQSDPHLDAAKPMVGATMTAISSQV